MRELMYENVDLKLKLDAVKAAMNGEALRMQTMPPNA